MGKKSSLYLKILANYMLAILVLLFLIFIFPKLLLWFWPFLVGWIIALIANPLVHFLEKRLNLIRKHSTAIVIVLALAVVISVLYFIMYVLIKQGVSFVQNIPDLYESSSEAIQGVIGTWREKFSVLPAKSREVMDLIIDKSGKIIDGVFNDFSKTGFTINNASNMVKSVAEGLIMTVMTILLSYFLTAEHDNIVKRARDKFPESMRKGYGLIVGKIVEALGGYLKAQLKIMACVFAILTVGLLLIDVEYAFLIALIIAFVDFLPVLGAGFIIWPWCVFDLVTGQYVKAVVLLVLYIICQVVRQFLQPKMVADSIGLSPLATIIYMFIGYRFLGVIGMIVGIPVGMILDSLYKAGVFDRLIEGAGIIVRDFNAWRKFEKKG